MAKDVTNDAAGEAIRGLLDEVRQGCKVTQAEARLVVRAGYAYGLLRAMTANPATADDPADALAARAVSLADALVVALAAGEAQGG